MTDDFSKYPESIAERKANVAQNAEVWTARDALISLLRDIDGGQIKVDIVFIAVGEFIQEPDGTINTRTAFRAAGKNHYELSGVAHRAIWMMQHE